MTRGSLYVEEPGELKARQDGRTDGAAQGTETEPTEGQHSEGAGEGQRDTKQKQACLMCTHTATFRDRTESWGVVGVGHIPGWEASLGLPGPCSARILEVPGPGLVG